MQIQTVRSAHVNPAERMDDAENIHEPQNHGYHHDCVQDLLIEPAIGMKLFTNQTEHPLRLEPSMLEAKA
jgi:hypothetical protein